MRTTKWYHSKIQWWFTWLTGIKYKAHYNFTNSGSCDLCGNLDNISYILPSVTHICFLLQSQFQDLLLPAAKFGKSHLSHSWLFIPTFTPECNYSLLTYLGGHAAPGSLQSSVSWSMLKIATSFWLLCLTQIRSQIRFPMEQQW